jgi:hypothetical protein
MTANQFRRLALEMADAVESAHMGHPDFRVRGKIFATLGAPDDGWGMVKLTPDQQQQFVHDQPNAFVPVPGGWGRKGATYVNLSSATPDTLRPALEAAWRNVAAD